MPWEQPKKWQKDKKKKKRALAILWLCWRRLCLLYSRCDFWGAVPRCLLSSFPRPTSPGHTKHCSSGGGGLECYGSCPAAPRPQCINSSDSPLAVGYQLQQLCGCSVSAPAALLPSEQLSTRRVGELRFIMPAGSEEISLRNLSPKEGFHKAFMG